MPKNAGNLIFELHFLKLLWGAYPQTPLGSKCLWHLQSKAPSMLAYKSLPFSLGFPVFNLYLPVLPKSGLAALHYHIIKGNFLIISYLVFLVSMLTCFWPIHNKCLKMGSKCQIFTRLRTRITIFSNLNRIMMIREIPRNRVIWYIEIALNDL